MKKSNRKKKYLRNINQSKILLKNLFSISHSALMIQTKKHASMRSWEARNSEQNYGIEDPEMAGSLMTSTE
jgi:hypothetical protein